MGSVPPDGFVAAAVFGIPQGFAGVAAHSSLIARLVLPLGMLAEPRVTRRFCGFYGTVPGQVSEIASGVILAVVVMRRGYRRHHD